MPAWGRGKKLLFHLFFLFPISPFLSIILPFSCSLSWVCNVYCPACPSCIAAWKKVRSIILLILSLFTSLFLPLSTSLSFVWKCLLCAVLPPHLVCQHGEEVKDYFTNSFIFFFPVFPLFPALVTSLLYSGLPPRHVWHHRKGYTMILSLWPGSLFPFYIKSRCIKRTRLLGHAV